LKSRTLAAERELIERTLHATGWNKVQAARQLGITGGQFAALLRKYGLQKDTKTSGS
jgi:DNA-binding NtrC family response regulator